MKCKTLLACELVCPDWLDLAKDSLPNASHLAHSLVTNPLPIMVLNENNTFSLLSNIEAVLSCQKHAPDTRLMCVTLNSPPSIEKRIELFLFYQGLWINQSCVSKLLFLNTIMSKDNHIVSHLAQTLMLPTHNKLLSTSKNILAMPKAFLLLAHQKKFSYKQLCYFAKIDHDILEFYSNLNYKPSYQQLDTWITATLDICKRYQIGFEQLKSQAEFAECFEQERVADTLSHYFEKTLQATRFHYNKRIEDQIKHLEQTTQTQISWDKTLEHCELSITLKLQDTQALETIFTRLIAQKKDLDAVFKLL